MLHDNPLVPSSWVKNSTFPPLGFWSHLQRSKIPKRFFLDFWPLKMEPIGCPETSVRNFHYTLLNDREGRSSDILRGWSLKSRKVQKDLQCGLMHRLVEKMHRFFLVIKQVVYKMPEYSLQIGMISYSHKNNWLHNTSCSGWIRHTN